MVEGFTKSWKDLIDKRIDALLTDDEYNQHTEGLSESINELISPYLQELDSQSKLELMDSISHVVFEAVCYQSKLVYNQAFSDAFIFLTQNIKENK